MGAVQEKVEYSDAVKIFFSPVVQALANQTKIKEKIGLHATDLADLIMHLQNIKYNAKWLDKEQFDDLQELYSATAGRLAKLTKN